ncbi:MAG: FAD-binding protein [Myxococcales bacterium]|nr:FAD-binding protein [Myxococcales bacterium]
MKQARLTPASASDVAAVLTDAAAKGTRLAVRGAATRDGLGHPTHADRVLDLSALAGIVDYQPRELVLTALPATPLAEIEQALAAEGQMLAFEPQLRGGTLAGALATNDSGPRRFRLGAARDHLLGFEAVSGRGEAFVAGGRVVKNVTGYDLSKLMCGSYGTLAVLTLVHVKVWPAPASVATVVLRGQGPADALRSLARAVASPHDPTAAAHVGGVTAVRLEGPERSVAHRAEAVSALLGADEVLDDDASRAWWAALRDEPMAGSEVWRVSLPPTDAAALLAATQPDRVAIDQAGGRLWLGYDGVGPDVRGLLRAGHATLVVAPPVRKEAVGVFHPRPAAVAALERRVKAQFDPSGILEPDRMGRQA